MAFGRKMLDIIPQSVNMDMPADRLPVDPKTGITEINSCENVIFRNGVLTRILGYTQIYDGLLAAPQFLINTSTALVNYWLYGCEDTVGVTDDATHYDITPTATLTPTTSLNQWTGDILNGIPVLNNEFNNPIWWDLDVTHPMTDLPGWPSGTKAKAVRAFKYHLIAMNISDGSGEFGDLILWSDAADPGSVPSTWAPAPDNEAGNALLSDTPGDIIDGIAFRDQFIVCKKDALYSLQYIGGNEVFAIRKITDVAGLLTRNCAATIKNMVVMLTNNDVIVFDGQSTQSIIDGRLRKILFSAIDPVHYVNSYVVANLNETEVWICIPMSGYTAPNIALVWNQETNLCGLRYLPSQACNFIARGQVGENADVPTWDLSTESWIEDISIWDSANFQSTAETLLACTDDFLLNMDSSSTNDGENIEGFFSKWGLDFGAPQQRKLLKRIWPRIEAPSGTIMSIRAGSQETPNGPIAWADAVQFIVGQQQKADLFASGYFLAFQILSDDIAAWKVSGLNIEYTLGSNF